MILFVFAVLALCSCRQVESYPGYPVDSDTALKTWEKLNATPPPDDIGALVRINGGSFEMGAPETAVELMKKRAVPAHYVEAALPRHVERVDTFLIGKYEVTASEFCAFLNEIRTTKAMDQDCIVLDPKSTVEKEGSIYKARSGYEHAPATGVQYSGALRYCAWLSEKTGKYYRLPTEAEWEFAARGPENRFFPWGDATPVGRGFFLADFPHLVRDYNKGVERPHVFTVGMFPSGATPDGVCDMSGNASEWCADWWCYNGSSVPEADSRLTEDCDFAPVRGGQAASKHLRYAAWSRYSSLKTLSGGDETSYYVGFRVLCEAEE